MTAAAMAFIRSVAGARRSGGAPEIWQAKNRPPMAAKLPEMAKTEIRIMATLIPARRAASTLPPSAKILRPYVVRRSTKSAITSDREEDHQGERQARWTG